MPPSETLPRRPTLLNSCAMAATAAEARFRVDYPNARTQSSRIIALDRGAAAAVCRLAQRGWRGARFFSEVDATTGNGQRSPTDATLRGCDGSVARLEAELADADLVVMVATADDGAETAAVVGRKCAERGITATGLVLADWGARNEAVSSLRPYAMVLVISEDEGDVEGILTALRV